jgi:preprotein translocase subunit SecD
MRRSFWVRIGIVGVALLASIWYLYPPKKTINLGLDLQGGIHLVLGVQVDKAIANEVDRAAEDMKGLLDRKGIGIRRVAREGDRAFVAELASPQSWNDAVTVSTGPEFGAFQRTGDDQAAGRFRMLMTDREANRLSDLAVRQGVETIRNRVDQFGVAEPTITREGPDRILIQLPGVQDPERAKALIGKTAHLEFKLLDERVTPEEALQGRLPDGAEIVYQRRVDKQTKTERKIPYVVQTRALLTGAELNRAEVQADPNSPGNWQVSIEFNAKGTRIFGEVTEQSVGKHLAIILDGSLYSAPRINERIPGGRAVITGQFTVDEARDLAIVLRAGALPAPVRIIEERTVGPSLGNDSIRDGLMAGWIGTALVVVFMVVYYNLSGIIAIVALLLNLIYILACLGGFGATLTLPGIAGLVLTVGMAVDTNVLIFERIREELRNKKSVRQSVELGYARAFRTILDAHLTAILSSLFLFQFGTGPIKGFAVTLITGLVANMFTAVLFTRMIYDFWLSRGKIERLSI